MSREFLLYLVALVAQDNGVKIESGIWAVFVVWIVVKIIVITITSVVKHFRGEE